MITPVKASTPFAIVLSTFKTDISSSIPRARFANFVQPGGKGLCDFLNDLSNGEIDISGSQVFGWYTLKTSSHDATPAERWVTEATTLATTHGVDLSPFYAIIIAVEDANQTSIMAMCTRSGIGTSDVQSGQPFDAITAAIVKAFDISLTAEGLNAPTLQKLGWLPNDRIFTAKSSARTTVHLGVLNNPTTPGYLMAKVSTASRVYSVEFRPLSLWDTSITNATVLIHQLTGVSAAGTQDNWRWCNKCYSLTYTGTAICAAGGVHDHSASGSYSLISSGTIGQPDWRWCRKCQELSFYGNGVTGPCPAGGTHDDSGSGNYLLRLNDSTAPGQKDWQWCNKCQGMAFAGNPSAGACASGGTHTHVGSGNYTIASSGGQDSWHWCSKCQMLAYDGYSHCAAGGAHTHVGSGNYTLTVGPDDPPHTISLVSQGHWQTGQVFKDGTQPVITVGAIDTVAKTITITIG